MEYYVFKTKDEADACVKLINIDKDWYPVVGYCNGKLAPQNQQTLRWVEAPLGMKDGSWAVPKVPEDRFDYMRVPVTELDKTDLLAIHGKDIRTLAAVDFTEPPEELGTQLERL